MLTRFYCKCYTSVVHLPLLIKTNVLSSSNVTYENKDVLFPQEVLSESAFAFGRCKMLTSIIKHQHFFPHRKLQNSIDPNMILIDPSPLLNTEINNIRLEFKNLVTRVKVKHVENSDNEDEYPEGTVVLGPCSKHCLAMIKRLHLCNHEVYFNIWVL